jgi:hypothetical protein
MVNGTGVAFGIFGIIITVLAFMSPKLILFSILGIGMILYGVMLIATTKKVKELKTHEQKVVSPKFGVNQYGQSHAHHAQYTQQMHQNSRPQPIQNHSQTMQPGPLHGVSRTHYLQSNQNVHAPNNSHNQNHNPIHAPTTQGMPSSNPHQTSTNSVGRAGFHSSNQHIQHQNQYVHQKQHVQQYNSQHSVQQHQTKNPHTPQMLNQSPQNSHSHQAKTHTMQAVHNNGSNSQIVQPKHSSIRLCPNCKATISASYRHCPHCGFHFHF